jgi:hypothetical protein
MGFQSQSGQVGFKTQTAPDTYDDPGSDGVFMRTRGGSLGPNRDLIIPDPEIGGSRDLPDAYLGSVSWSGEIEFYARMDALATLIYGAFGAKTTDDTDHASEGWATHSFTPIDTGALPWLSLEENIGGSFDTFQYSDVKVGNIHLESDANGYLMGNFGAVARKQTAGNTKTAAPAFDTSPLMVGTNIGVTLGGIALPAKSFSFDFNNNLEDDDFRLGSFYLGDVTEKRREVMAGFTIRPEDSGYWRQAVYGQTGAVAPGGLMTKEELVITASTYEYVGSSVAQTYAMTITIPKVTIEPFSAEPNGDDILEHDITLRGLRPDNAVKMVTVDIVNSLVAVL